MRIVFLTLLAVVYVFTSQSFALAAIDKAELKSRKSSLTSKGTHRRLSRAHALMGKDKLNDALQILERLKKSTEKRPHEHAQVLQAIGYIYAQQDKFAKALSVLKAAIDLKAMPYAPTLSTLYTMAQVNLAQENYAGAEKILNQWFALADKPSADAYVLLATIFAQKKKQKKALEFVTKAIDMSDKPKESWLSFAVAMNYELKRYPEAARLLEKLTGLYPEKKKYWKQLAGVYLNIDKNDKALASLELANKAGYLDQEAEIMNLVSLNLYGGIPLKAAKLLQAALKGKKVKSTQKHYEILGDCWAQAEEMDRALKAYAQSAKFAKDGRIFAKQGRIYLEQENWKEAEQYLSQGLNKGKLRKAEHVHMALGIARFNLKKFDAAINAFTVAKAKSKKLERQAEQWISYVQAESDRLNPKPVSVEEGEGESKTL